MDCLRYQRGRLLTKALSCLQQEPENQKLVNTFCRRLGYIEQGTFAKKIQAIHTLFASHGIDERKALPLVGKYYARETIQYVLEELGKIRQNQGNSALFSNFSEITQKALENRAAIVASLQGTSSKALKDLVLQRIGWKKQEASSYLRQEELVKKMRLALQSGDLSGVLSREREMIARRSPEKKAALVAEMLLGEKRRVSILENQLQVIKQEVVNQEMEGVSYMIPQLRKQQKQLEITLSVAKHFCTKAAEAVVAEYNAKERNHLKNLVQIEQFVFQ